ncbi:MAG: hypothetical protein Q8K86_11560 [Candidatus Nanopelagicaceae bacterium]|nr:hypothetical protein [Candidatus Nanopelagicaceae bacterium]
MYEKKLTIQPGRHVILRAPQLTFDNLVDQHLWLESVGETELRAVVQVMRDVCQLEEDVDVVKHLLDHIMFAPMIESVEASISPDQKSKFPSRKFALRINGHAVRTERGHDRMYTYVGEVLGTKLELITDCPLNVTIAYRS